MAEILYDELNLADMVDELDRIERIGTNSVLDNFVTLPKEGPLTVRLLPPAKGKRFYCETRIHRMVYPDGRKKNIHCTRVLQKIGKDRRWLDANQKDPCPICKYYQDLWKKVDAFEKAGDDASVINYKKQAGLVKPQERYYYNCIVRQQINKKTEELEKNIGPKILSIPMTVHEKIVRGIVGSIADDEPALGDVSDVKNGRDFKIMKKIKKGSDWPSYEDSKFLEPSPLGDKEQVTKWLGNLHDLSSLRRLISHKDMEVELKKYLGLVPMNEGSEEDTSFNHGENESLEDKVENLMNSKHGNNKTNVVAEAEQHLGGSGNDDTHLSDDEFFKQFNDS